MSRDTTTSEQPQGFERTRRTWGLLLGPVAMLTVLISPTGLSADAHRLAAIFALVVVYWVSEAIPLPATALLGAALTVPFGIATPKEAFAAFSHPIIFLFLGSFLIARAMAHHELDRRIALFVLSRRWVGESPTRILFAFGAIGWFLSMWMSNTATTAMMLPIAIGVLRTLGGEEGGATGSRYATGLLLMIAYACAIGGVATPVGTPPNLIAIGLIDEVLGRRIEFFEWMAFATPIAAGGFALIYLLLSRMYPGSELRLDGASDTIRAARASLGRWSRGEKAALAAFLTAVVLWVVPGLLTIALGRDSALATMVARTFPKEPVAVLAALMLFVIPIDWGRREFALGWRDAVRIDWGTILLFGGGLSLGGLAFSTGLAGALGDAVARFVGGQPLWLILLVAVYVADILTEFTSNTATANLLIPTFLAIGGTLAADPILPALAVTVGCSLAFCLPVATPPNAIVYGSGRVPLTSMIRAGVWLDIGCGLVAWLVLMAMSTL